MEAVRQSNSYQCDRCGSTNVVAAPVIYEQGTRTYSGTFNSGISRSQAAVAAAPPDTRSYRRPLMLWGSALCFSLFWGFAGLGRLLGHSQASSALQKVVTVLFLGGVLCLVGMLLSFRRVARYNREVYPQRHWQWEHTYICKRCGRNLLIPS
jgi:TM2 domain-containing membrane protein YozV